MGDIMITSQYPVLKLKYDSVLPIAKEISLNGHQIPCVTRVDFCSCVDNKVNRIQIEILAEIEIETPVDVKQELVTYIEGEKYKLVKVENENVGGTMTNDYGGPSPPNDGGRFPHGPHIFRSTGRKKETLIMNNGTEIEISNECEREDNSQLPLS